MPKGKGYTQTAGRTSNGGRKRAIDSLMKSRIKVTNTSLKRTAGRTSNGGRKRARGEA